MLSWFTGSRRRLVVRAMTLIAVILAIALARRARNAGDGWEYACMLESWFRHFSPEQRLADAESARAIVAAHAPFFGDPRDGFFLTASGHWFSYHFWFYSLLCVPAKAILHLVRADEFYALACTNAALFAGAIALALRRASWRRIAFILLAASGPIAWYITWQHAEVFEWAFVVTSLCAYERRRHALAALCAAVAAMQAPPIALLALAPIGAAILARRWRTAALAVAGAAVALVPAAFYKAEYGQANLILAIGMASEHLASAHRVLVLLFDLDQGMLPYVPVTLALGVLAVAVGKRRLEAAVFLGVALAMAALATQTVNLNTGCIGMNRYATWIAPVFAFVAARNLRLPTVRIAAAAGAALQAALALPLNGDDDAHVHHPIAEVIVRRAPSLYSQDIETFAERTTGQPLDWPFKPLVLPIAMGDATTPSKILVDKRTLADLDRYFDVPGSWLAQARAEHEHDRGPFYVQPGGLVHRRLSPRSDGPLLAFGNGWSSPEGDPAHPFRWMGARGELTIRRAAAGPTLRLTGTVPSQLSSQPTITITIRGALVDRFLAPLGTSFTRDLALPEGDDEALPMTIETSLTGDFGGRTLGYELTRWDAPLTQTNIGGPGVHFVGSWSEPFGVAPDEGRCIRSDASIEIDADAAHDATLAFIAVSPEQIPSTLSTWRVVLDDREVEHGPLFRSARRLWPLRGERAHTVRFSASPTFETMQDKFSLCFWALRVVPSALLD
jgi:hypothetical protein